MSTKNCVKMYVPQKIHEVVTALHEDHKACEWSAFCKIIDWKDWYAIIDMFFPNQDNSSWLNTTTQEWLDQFCNWVIENEPTEMSKRKMQIHSHHSMWLFWSWTDNEQNRAWNYGWNKHFFNAVTAYSTVWETKKQYEKQTWNNVWYYWCINFYDIDVEVPMEFIVWMDLDYERVKNKYDKIVENKKPSLKKIAEWIIEEKISPFEEYVTRISKNDFSVDKEDLVKKATDELVIDFVKDIQWDYKQEIQKCYDDNYIVENQYVKLTTEEALRLLSENEIKKVPTYPAKTSYSWWWYSAKIYTYPKWKTPSWYWRDKEWHERILFDDRYGKMKIWDDKFFCNITWKFFCDNAQRRLSGDFYDDFYDDDFYR